jgi:glucose/arabinose dehydrogenase
MRRSLAVLIACAAVGLLPATAQASSPLDADPFTSETLAQFAAAAADLPTGFTDTTIWSGLTTPTAVRWAPTGQVFVAQKTGVVNRYDGVADPTPTVAADLRQNVDDFLDRGLLGLAVDPAYGSGRPYIYVMYTYDKDPNSTRFPAWNDNCPDPPGADGYGCPALGRLSRIDPDGTEHVLIQDWCIVYSTHTVGDLRFGPDGALYASAGDGASYQAADYGQGDSNSPTPANACGDPPVPVNGDQEPPTAEGGALRSQSFRRPAGEPVSLDGSIIRIDPDTGAAKPDNPAASDPNPSRRRIVAYGFRNPFRFTWRPGTGEIWMGDVGWNTWEEVNRLPDTTTIRNYGWPCYEGQGRMSAYDNLNLNLCESLYSQNNAVEPWFTYQHTQDLGTCFAGTSAPTGISFYTANQFPTTYRNGLFVADYARQCIYFFRAGTNGVPDPSTVQVFASGSGGPVDLQQGPDGALYYADIINGTIQRIAYPSGNHAPTARATATPDHGSTPLTVQFGGTTSSDPDNDPLTYSWDLNGDGTFGDSVSPTPSFTYTTPGNYTIRLRVSDPAGNSDTTTLPIQAGDPPTPVIDTPAATFTWAVGDPIAYSGHATDGAGNPVPASGLTWQLNIRHCSRTDTSQCHTHFGASVAGVSSGSFVAPNHDWPSHLELVLTATANGLSASKTIALQPKTAQLTLNSSPSGASLTMGADTGSAPFTETFIQNSTTDVTAPAATTIGGTQYAFGSWSDGGARTHTITIPRNDLSLTATFAQDTAVTMGGAEAVGTSVSQAPAGASEVYRLSASKTGIVTRLRLYVDGASTASALTLGLYSDQAGTPTTLLGSGSRASVTPNDWNEVTLATPINVTAGTNYWLALLNPLSSTGTLRWRDHAGGQSGSPERTSLDRALTALPATWATQSTFSDGPVSGYLIGSTGAPPTSPALSVSPTSLAFSATTGQGNPASKTVSVANTGGGTLNFTAADDAAWLSVTPGSGTAPQDVTAAVNTAGLAAGTYSANVTITASGATGSPKAVPVTLTVSDPPPTGTTTLGGSEQIGTSVSSAPAGAGEAYRFTATTTGVANKLRLYVDGGSAASQLILGLYGDSGGNPATLLGSGQISGLTAGAWNEVPLASGINLTAGTNYWFAALNPNSSTGTLRWRDHAGGVSGGPERTSQGRTLSALPATWASQASFTDGPLSAYIVGATGPPPPPALSVSPTSLAYSGTAGGSSPAAKTLTVSNTGGGTLNFTASDDASWLTVSPASGSAPRDVTATVDTAGLAAGTYTATITINGGGISGSPRTVPVTLTLAPPTPPVLAITPSTLTFSATVGGSAPPSQPVAVSNTGAGTLSWTTSDDQPWLSASPAGGTNAGTVNVSVNPAGLSAGTYTGTVTVAAAGASGSPKTVAVTFSVTPPSSGLVGAWGFDEASGATVTDRSGKGNSGTITGATRTTTGKFGGALAFTGSGRWVTVPNSTSLELTTGLTVEGWVNPTANGAAAWRTMALKETATGMSWGLYPFGDGNFPSAHAFTTSELWAAGTTRPALNTWTHIAATYDGTTLRLLVNGVQAATRAQTGSLLASTQPLRIGGNALWAEWFQGQLDEIRVYNRALTATEITTDMGTPITPPG